MKLFNGYLGHIPLRCIIYWIELCTVFHRIFSNYRQSVSQCYASLAALRLDWLWLITLFVLFSENKYNDDDDEIFSGLMLVNQL